MGPIAAAGIDAKLITLYISVYVDVPLKSFPIAHGKNAVINNPNIAKKGDKRTTPIRNGQVKISPVSKKFTGKLIIVQIVIIIIAKPSVLWSIK